MNLKRLLSEMTLSEKIGQLVQLTPNFFEEGAGEITGPLQELGLTQEDLFQIGSVLGTHTKEQVIQIQGRYLEKSRLKIPLMFMADVVHGYETIFPVPLGLASSWNPDLIEEMASLSGREASDAGVHVTFSPMVDLVRDARWGRVMESTGEDPYLNGLFAAAFVKGYQGDAENLASDYQKIAACVKHFIGYGAAEGGRDYNTVDISAINLYQYYLPSFKAAIEAGVKLVMTSFNTINGIPASGNKWLMNKILREHLGFKQVLISDWAAIWEMIPHGVARDLKQAAQLAIEAGVDIDMMTPAYQQNLEALVASEAISQDLIDQAVLRVLQLKADLGLFEDPYRGLLAERQWAVQSELAAASRRIASQSMVLLKNEQILPLNTAKKIGLVGPLATSHDILGAWSWIGDLSKSVTVAEGLRATLPDLPVVGTADPLVFTDQEKAQMLTLAKEVDTLVVALGESSEETGEAASKAAITLPASQIQLLKDLYALNQQIVVVLFNGRPLELREVLDHSQGVLEAWFPGSEGGHAVADILLGAVNPSGKLTMSFPAKVGQVPLYYNQLRTGRPLTSVNQDQKYISRYLDVSNDPVLPFGYGLSYTTFDWSVVQSSEQLAEKGSITFDVKIKNTGKLAGKETIQCYLKDLVAEVARPKRELKQFVQVFLAPGEEKVVTLTIEPADLAYIHSHLESQTDPGEYHVYIGSSSLAPKVGQIYYSN